MDRLPSAVQGIKSREYTKGERVPSLISSEGHLGQFSQAFCIVLLDGCSIDERAQGQRGLNWIRSDAYLSFQKVFRSSMVCAAPRIRANKTTTPASPKPQKELQKSKDRF